MLNVHRNNTALGDGPFGARLLLQSYQYPNLSDGADRVAGQLRWDKECPFSGVTKSGRVWRNVPESDARSCVFLLCGWNNKCIGKHCVSQIWKSSVMSQEAAGNSWDILNAILGHKYNSDHSNGFICNEWSLNLQQKWVLLQSVKGELSVHDPNCFVDISTEEACTAVLLGN